MSKEFERTFKLVAQASATIDLARMARQRSLVLKAENIAIVAFFKPREEEK